MELRDSNKAPIRAVFRHPRRPTTTFITNKPVDMRRVCHNDHHGKPYWRKVYVTGVKLFLFFPLSHFFFLCDRISSSAGTNSNSNDNRSFMAPCLVGALGAYKRLQMTHSYHHISVTYSRWSFLCCHCVNEIESVKSIIIVQCINTCVITTNILSTAAAPSPPPQQ